MKKFVIIGTIILAIFSYNNYQQKIANTQKTHSASSTRVKAAADQAETAKTVKVQNTKSDQAKNTKTATAKPETQQAAIPQEKAQKTVVSNPEEQKIAEKSVSEPLLTNSSTTSNKLLLPAEYQAVLESFPIASISLSKEIRISNQKSKTGLQDLQKMIHYINNTQKKFTALSAEFQEKMHENQLESESDETHKLINKLVNFLEQSTKNINNLKLQDNEVKQIAERLILGMKLSKEVMTTTLNNLSILREIDDKNDRIAQEFTQQYQQKAQALKQALDANNEAIEKAVSELDRKYIK